MNKKSFEEQFPSLKGSMYVRFVKENYISRQRVKEQIIRLGRTPGTDLADLLKWLGLDEEE